MRARASPFGTPGWRVADAGALRHARRPPARTRACRAPPEEKAIELRRQRVWDRFRLEGLAFVWYFRGAPHVHVWVHVAAADAGVQLNA